MKLLSIALASSLLFGCSSFITDTQLAKQNKWEQLGFSDGATGQHQRSATELTFLTVVNKEQVEQYNEGFDRGNGIFCELNSAYEHGLKGKKYQGQCINFEHEPDLVTAWHKGYERYTVLQDSFELSSD
ncbi:DUF2799 domain-containing protein [Photobacterium minamisatsumaniensis]|uniref:DUF2799 domain-containing protein n=1 Tax=Photobacterium minamisatsumaniensis TaxID=2910233 RepID=UPI003D11B139